MVKKLVSPPDNKDRVTPFMIKEKTKMNSVVHFKIEGLINATGFTNCICN